MFSVRFWESEGIRVKDKELPALSLTITNAPFEPRSNRSGAPAAPAKTSYSILQAVAEQVETPSMGRPGIQLWREDR